MIKKSVDLTKVPKTLSHYLAQRISKIDKMTPDEIIDMLKDAIKFSYISERKAKEILEAAQGYIYDKKRLMKYVADIILRGAGHEVLTNVQLIKKLAEIYGENELIIKIAISSLPNVGIGSGHDLGTRRRYEPSEGGLGLGLEGESLSEREVKAIPKNKCKTKTRDFGYPGSRSMDTMECPKCQEGLVKTR